MCKQGVQKGDLGSAPGAQCEPNRQSSAALAWLDLGQPTAKTFMQVIVAQRAHSWDWGPERVGRPVESIPGTPGRRWQPRVGFGEHQESPSWCACALP